MEIEREYNKELDNEKVLELLSLKEENYKYDEKNPNYITPEKQYNFLKELFKDTELDELFNDRYPRASIEQKRDFENGCFVNLKTSRDYDQYISFVIKDNELVFSLSHYLKNRQGYKCYCTPDLIIHENSGFMGSWIYLEYDLNGNLLSQKSKRF